VLHGHVLALDVAGFVEAFAKRVGKAHGRLDRPEVDEGDDGQCRLLRAYADRPCDRAAEKRDELAPPHSITSSARASSVGGISSPSALAVLALITSSNFVDRWIGRSPGFSPLRMRAA